jgi:hypothetical protein
MEKSMSEKQLKDFAQTKRIKAANEIIGEGKLGNFPEKVGPIAACLRLSHP